jgi:Cys-rich protein (TIGR04453 family)
MKIVAVGFLSIGMALLAGACGGSAVESACQAACDCASECTDAELDECIQEGENALKQADDAGCGSQYEDLIDCFVSNAECKDGELDDSALETECTQEAIDAFACLSEAGVDP